MSVCVNSLIVCVRVSLSLCEDGHGLVACLVCVASFSHNLSPTITIQYAYCIAAAHLQLPHTLIDSLMISAAGAGGEGWKFIKNLPPSDTCSIATTSNNSNTNEYHLSVRPLPSLIHYCQRYIVDNQYFFGKRKMPHQIFTCDHPLFTEPPQDLGQGTQYSEKDRMNAFMVCTLTKFTNDAMIFFKDRNCGGNDEDGTGGGGNRERKDLLPRVNLARKAV